MTTHTMPSVIGGNICCEITFDYDPPQEQTKTDPAWPHHILICAIDVQGEDFDIDDLSQSALERLTAECLQHITKGDSDE